MTGTFMGDDGSGDDMDLDVLSAYLDDELDASERAEVEARLADSPAWRAELDDVTAARLAIRGLPERDAPPGFWDDVVANVAAVDVDGDDAATEERPVAAPIPLAPRRRNRRMLWLASAAAAIVALVTAVVVIPQRAEVRPNVTAVIAQHGAQSSHSGDPISPLAPVGPFAGFRR